MVILEHDRRTHQTRAIQTIPRRYNLEKILESRTMQAISDTKFSIFAKLKRLSVSSPYEVDPTSTTDCFHRAKGIGNNLLGGCENTDGLCVKDDVPLVEALFRRVRRLVVFDATDLRRREQVVICLVLA